ncbi:DEAD/DEAH box helicase [Candidatus Woesearchaeota archaeon]|nr:DEAD/DEAH box helicase [Candidatus Woesearchaeota archaeon]
MLAGFKPRLYQETILSTAALKNALVVLPTGMGKTGVALMLAAQRLASYPNSKILILAPTKPLVEQHMRTFKDHLKAAEDSFVVFTGSVPPAKREELWKSAKIIFSTPQGLENDIISGRISLKDVSLIVFDEAHRATGDYSYAFIAKQYNERADWPRVLALTASPGSEIDKIKEVCSNLFIEAVEVRTDTDPDVQPYLQQVDIEKIVVDFPDELRKVKRLLDLCVRSKIGELRRLGVRFDDMVSKKEILRLQALLQAKMASGEKDFEVMKAVSVLAEIIKVQHALELLETQGISPLNKYMTSLFHDASSSRVKAVKNLASDSNFKSAFALVSSLAESDFDHPKINLVKEKVSSIVHSNPKSKIILFTQFRDTAVKLKETLEGIDGVFPEVFVGQAKKGNTGLSQKKQVEMLDMFRDGLINVLIATSVAEEGLDIPSVDVVIFYEPIPSAIRAIQRRGRTGRHEKGRIILLVTKGTRDEGYLWSSRSKEKKMNFVLESLKKQLDLVPKAQRSLSSFEKAADAGVKIFADYREKSTGVVKSLADEGVNLRLEMLNCADYVLSSRVGVELKTVPDFVNSIIDGRLLEQLKSMKQNFERPVVIIQGKEDIYSIRNVHPNAIRGMLATISISYGIPIVHTKDENDSAQFLIAVARREQDESKKDFSPHADRKPMSIKEQQEYIVSALPSVGPALAKVLLENLGSVDAVFSASEEELKQIAGVGDKIAKIIRDAISAKY